MANRAISSCSDGLRRPMLATRMRKGACHRYFEGAVLFPVIALIVGSLIGLIAKNEAP
jgi:hypothetical protein